MSTFAQEGVQDLSAYVPLELQEVDDLQTLIPRVAKDRKLIARSVLDSEAPEAEPDDQAEEEESSPADGTNPEAVAKEN